MKTFQINEIYQSYMYAWNRTIANIKIKKLPTVGGGTPHTHTRPPPPARFARLGLVASLPRLPPPPLTRNARYATAPSFLNLE